MKRLLFLFMLVLASGIYAQNALPVIPFGERKADLYYWDTNWYDRYEHLHPNTTPYPAGTYIVRVTTSSGVANKRLVKK